MQHGELRTIRCSWSIDKLFKLIFTYISYIFIAGSDSSRGPAETENPNKNDDNEEVRCDSLRHLPEWLKEFKDNLVDKSVPEHPDASRSSHELPSGPRAKVVFGMHRIFTYFWKDRNCEICLRTKITRASSGTVVSGTRLGNMVDTIMPM